MWMKIKKSLTQNIGLKILALAFSIVLWLVVVNVDDPNQTKTFTTTVQVINEDVLTGAGKYYSIVDNNNTVSFRVTAKRSIIERLSSSDFTAVADMNYLEDDSRIPVEITATRYTNSVSISSKPKYLKVTVEDQMTQKFVIEGIANGDPAEGSAVGNISVSPNVVTVTGPAKIVAKIDKVQAVCDVTGMNADITENVVPVLYDKNGDKVDVSKLKLSLSTVEMNVEIKSIKTIGITVETTGTLPDGLELKQITTNPESVEIMGKSSVLNDITMLTIPGTVIDLSQVTETLKTQVDITSYLPEDVTLVDDNQAKVEITVSVEGEKKQTYSVPTTNITMQNLPAGLTAKITEENINVVVMGMQQELDELGTAQITGVIDGTGLTPGTHTLPVTITAGKGLKTDSVKVTVKVTESNANAE